MLRFGAKGVAFRFAPQDRRALDIAYSEAAQDSEFQADNEAVAQDFAALAAKWPSRPHAVAAGSTWAATDGWP